MTEINEKTCPKCKGKGTIIEKNHEDEEKQSSIELLWILVVIVVISIPVTTTLVVYFTSHTFYDILPVVAEVMSGLVPVLIIIITVHLVVSMAAGDRW